MEHPENDSQYIGLTVNGGVAQPPIVNPYLSKRPRRKPLPSVSELVEGIIKGDVTTLSRAVTLVESLAPEHYALAQEVEPLAGATVSSSARSMVCITICRSW